MTTLTIRNLKEETKAKLRQQAAQKGHSMEEEARRILDRAVNQEAEREEKGFGTFVQGIVAEVGGFNDLEIPPRSTVRPAPDFN